MHPLAGHPNTSLDESVTWCTDNLLSFKFQYLQYFGIANNQYKCNTSHRRCTYFRC